MQIDAETLAAALLHDTLEDTEVELNVIEYDFGPRVARLVEGVTNLGRLPWADDASTADLWEASPERMHQMENLRKMFLTVVNDIGFVLIKLADHLHNMRTLDALPPEKQAKKNSTLSNVVQNPSRGTYLNTTLSRSSRRYSVLRPLR
jgi:GTP pyrophosphokinase